MTFLIVSLEFQYVLKVFLLNRLLCVTNGPIVMPCLCCFFSLCIFLTTESFGKCFCSEAHTLTVHFSIYCSLMLLLLLLLLTSTNTAVLLKRMARILLTVTHTRHEAQRHTLFWLKTRKEATNSHKDTHEDENTNTHTHLCHPKGSWPHPHLCTCSLSTPKKKNYNFLLTLTYLLFHSVTYSIILSLTHSLCHPLTHLLSPLCCIELPVNKPSAVSPR